MTHKLFWQNPYQTELDTTITSISGQTITVDRTIFYAFSGGQESDTGTIGGKRVLEARKDGREILYTLEDGHHLHPGDPARIVIDWARRYRLMRLHFAAELILELTYRHFAGIPKIGAHIAEDKSRIDFEWGENIAPAFPVILSQAQALIEADYPIISSFSDEVNERRTWEIEGFAKVACGGTHLRRKNVGKGKERIEITLRE
jgi:alanyl-tRNA synthetase